MARQPRLTVPGYPHHVIQRGTNRQSIVKDDFDRQYLLDLFEEYSEEFEVAIHAYVLMDNHFHLLVTPATGTSLPNMMQAVGRTYVRHYNLRHNRVGALWEGRYRSNLIESESYLLTCMMYIDLNPVRAGMVTTAQDHKWSSHRHLIGSVEDKLITPHPLYWMLGDTPFGRQAAYAAMVEAGINRKDQDALTHTALCGWALGSDTFIKTVQRHTSRRVSQKQPGRPTTNPRNRKRPVPN